MKLLALVLASLAFVSTSFRPALASPVRVGDPVEAAPPVLRRVAVLGASVSAGFGLDPELDLFSGQESALRLATVVDASIVGAHDAPVDRATMAFFMRPADVARKTAKEAAEAKPSMVVALDYLFWMTYGRRDPGDPKRFEAGLKELEVFTCPVLVGDLPDFNGVEVSPMMLPPQAIPPKETLVKQNERLREWAKAHANVVVVPVRDMFAKLVADQAIELRGNKFGAGAKRQLMQVDGLHTTLDGTSALWVLALDTWLATKPQGVDAKALEFDVPTLVRKAQAAKAAQAKGGASPAAPAKPKEKAGAGTGGG